MSSKADSHLPYIAETIQKNLPEGTPIEVTSEFVGIGEEQTDIAGAARYPVVVRERDESKMYPVIKGEVREEGGVEGVYVQIVHFEAPASGNAVVLAVNLYKGDDPYKMFSLYP